MFESQNNYLMFHLFALRQGPCNLCPITIPLSLFHVTTMSKRGNSPPSKGNTKVKRRKGIKVRAIVIPDSDEGCIPQNVGTDYARLVQTQVKTSGKVGNITTYSVSFLDTEGVANDLLAEVDTNDVGDMVENVTLAMIPKTRRKQRKANDSVSLPQPSCSPALLMYPSYEDVVLAYHAIYCAG